MFGNIRKIIIYCLIILFLVVNTKILFSFDNIKVFADSNSENINVTELIMDKGNEYAAYLEKNDIEFIPGHNLELNGSEYATIKNTSAESIKSYKGKNDVLSWTDSQGSVEWEFDIVKEGYYEIIIEYYPLENRNKEIEIDVRINEEFPFSEAANISLERMWKDDGPIKKDLNDNEYSPRQIQELKWNKNSLSNSDGKYDDPYMFYFEKGKSKVEIYSIQEPFIISKISLKGITNPEKYDNYLLDYNVDSIDNEYVIDIPAQTPDLKSNDSIRALNDRSDPLTQPYSASKIRLNIISWQKPSQWVEWEFKVPESGFYNVSFRYQQPYIKGFFTTRKMYINDEIPFEEAKTIRFAYSEKFTLTQFANSDGELYKVHLKKGVNKIRLEAVLGELSETIRRLDEVIYELNYMYRKIIVVTGTQPDIYRDYRLDSEIPGLVDNFKANAVKLRTEFEYIVEKTGNEGNDAYIIDILSRQLEDLVEKPESIPQRIDVLKSNIGSLSAWLMDIKTQPIDLDCIYISTPEAKLPQTESNFWQRSLHEIKMFISSFFEDYNSLEGIDSDKNITLWLSSGRDQAQVLRAMIDDMFTPDNGITVNLKLVNASMVQAFLSKSGPDVAIMQNRGQPVNLAARGALLDLSQFEDFDKVKDRFQNNALIPYSYGDGYFGIPDSQHFYMMFYRMDIFEELKLSPPKTWDDLYSIIPILQRRNMDVGLPYVNIDAWGMIDSGVGARNIFPSLLLQRGGNFYKKNLSSTDLLSESGQISFKEWTDFYKLYSIPLTYDFYNRFRTGEVPLAIAPYTEYNRLVAAAPEIKNLWNMVPIPGTEKSDGTIDISQGGAGTASVIMSNTRSKNESWEFIKWWTGAQAQTRYSLDIESVLGEIGRYPTANKEALKAIPWPKEMLENLQIQFNEIKEIPEVIGGYYLMIGLENAFIETVYGGKNHREALSVWDKKINDEIVRKRREFGIE